MNNKERGLYPKYYVAKRNELGVGARVEDWVFVLNPSKDKGAVFALRAYAWWAEENGYETLAKDLREKIKEFQ